MMYHILLVALFFLQATESHKMGFGTCPTPKGKDGFDFKSFTGAWYVVHKVKTSVSCLMDAFYIESSGQFMYNEQSLTKNPEAVLKLEADINVASGGGDGQYTIVYSRFVPDASLTILDTDYENWAVIYKCQQWPLVNRKSGSIMVRNLNFDNADTLERAFTILEAASIERADLRTINHQDCVDPKDANFVFNVDGIKVGIDGKIGGTIRDTVNVIGKTLSNKVNQTFQAAKEDYEKFDPEENVIDDQP